MKACAPDTPQTRRRRQQAGNGSREKASLNTPSQTEIRNRTRCCGDLKSPLARALYLYARKPSIVALTNVSGLSLRGNYWRAPGALRNCPAEFDVPQHLAGIPHSPVSVFPSAERE